MKNIFTYDHWNDINFNGLEDYEWKSFDNSDTRLSRLCFKANTWEDDTPQLCFDGVEKCKEVFKKINPNCEIVALEKCLFQRSYEGNVIEQKNIHRDSHEEDRWSALWFLEGSGGTTLYNKWDINALAYTSEFKPGRVIVFASQYWHGQGFPVTGWRLIVNYVFHVKNLVDDEINRPLCECGASKEHPYCDSTHNSYLKLA